MKWATRVVENLSSQTQICQSLDFGLSGSLRAVRINFVV